MTSAKDCSFEMQITFHNIRKERTITSSETRAVLCSICPDFVVGGQRGEALYWMVSKRRRVEKACIEGQAWDLVETQEPEL